MRARWAIVAAIAAAAPAHAASLDVARLLGGTGSDEAHAIAVDRRGRIWIAGSTSSGDLVASPGAIQPQLAGATDAVIARLDPDGSVAVLTYFGGSGLDTASDVAVDAHGDVYVVGETSSANFPTTAGVVQSARKGVDDGWVAKLDEDGALVWSTHLGGPGGFYSEGAAAVAVDGSGHAYVTGRAPAGFPVTDDAFQTDLGGQRDAFVAKLQPDATGLVYATYLGGPGDEEGTGIAVDADGRAFVAGRVLSPAGFPTTAGAFREAPGGGSADGFVAALTPNGDDLAYSTFLGGANNDQIFDLALGPGGRAFVVGHTNSTDFPTTAGALREDPRGSLDLFVAALATDGASLVYSTYLGGSSFDQVCSGGAPYYLPYAGIAVDSAGRATIAACTSSRSDFPLEGALRSATSSDEGAVSTLDPTGSALAFSTFLGGSSSDDGAFDVATDARGRLYVTGVTASGDFPTTPGGGTASGGSEAFVAKITTPEPAALHAALLAAATLARLARVRRRDMARSPLTLRAPFPP